LEDWEYQVAEFAKDFRVITFDLRGHGQSDKPAGQYSMQMFASDIAALMNQLRLPPAHIVGISLGGGIAFQFAIDNPEITRSLTVVTSGPELILRTLKEKLAIWMRFWVVQFSGLQKLGAIVADKIFPDPADAQKKQGFLDRYARNEPGPYKAALRAFV